MSTATQTWALVRDTFRESFARKIFWGFLGCSTALILVFLLALHIDLVEGAMAAVSIFGQSVDRGRLVEVDTVVRKLLGGVAAFLFSAGLFLSVFAAAGLIPTVFEPGRIELLLSKPVTRTRLLLGRYLGTLAVIAANMAYLVLGVWIVLGAKTGVWHWRFLLSAVLTVFCFAVMLTIVLLVAVLSSSPALATMVAFFFLIISPVLAQHAKLAPLFNAQWPRDVVKTLYYLFPKVYDMGNLARLALIERSVGSWMPLWSSAAFAAVTLAAGLWVFSRKDY